MNVPPVIAYIFERYPVLSQTFLHHEIAGLSREGLRIEIHSMFPPADQCSNPALKDVPVNYFRWWNVFALIIALPRELLRDPTLLRDGWRLWSEHRPNNRENFRATLWAVIFAICRAKNFRCHPPALLHATRATGPATAAAILSRLCNLPFSFGGHAYDIYRYGGDAFLEPKLRAARFVHTTTEAAAAYLRQRWDGAPAKIVLAKRGLEQLPPPSAWINSMRPIHLLSVGRLVSKKGHAHQFNACALLKSWEIPFEARIVGDGPLRHELQAQINCAGLNNLVILCGAQPPREVQEEYRWADIFWHTGIIDAEGDRDGLPNVIPEAFAHCLPVISNGLPATTEALIHETNGLAVDVTNATELANAVQRLAQNPAFRRQLGENGRRWVEENFLISSNSKTLAQAFLNALKK
jgi:colanic acid/amylovoran biosynthesis glycosyltransferase